MYLLIGLAAIITAVINLIQAFRHRETKYFRFISMALTALTMCAFYSDAAQLVLIEDWSAMIDILPAVSKVLWFCVGSSIFLNGITLFGKKD